MPFYEYQCKRCGHTLEAMQKIHDAPLKKCPACGKSALERLMSAPVFRLKGSGWYETDFKSDQEGKRNLADRPEADEKKGEADKAAAKPAEGADGAKKPAEKSVEKPVEKPAESKTPAAATPAKRAAAKAGPPAKAPSAKVPSAKAPPRRVPAKRPAKKPARKASGRR
jgi:putative FmdB family regulatory protein